MCGINISCRKRIKKVCKDGSKDSNKNKKHTSTYVIVKSTHKNQNHNGLSMTYPPIPLRMSMLRQKQTLVKQVKGWMAHNGKPSGEWLNKEESSSLTVGLDSPFLAMMIDTREARDIVTADKPNAFTQTPMHNLDMED